MPASACARSLSSRSWAWSASSILDVHQRSKRSARILDVRKGPYPKGDEHARRADEADESGLHGMFPGAGSAAAGAGMSGTTSGWMDAAAGA